MSPFKNVTLLGKGPVGSIVLQELVDAGFSVKVLGRSEKNKEGLPAGVTYAVVDYNSLDNLQSAFRGQDVVVSTIGFEGILGQKLVIDAAIKAGVKRFVPSDFGSLTTDPAAANLPQHFNLVEIQKYLKAKAEAGLIEYTIFSIGGFTDYLLTYGFAFDWANKTAELWEDGTNPISTTSLAGTAKAIAGALKNPGPTKNRILHLHELVVTELQLLNLAKKYSPNAEWNVTKIENSEEELKRLIKQFQENPNELNIMALLKGSIKSGAFNAYYKNVDNDLVGLELLDERDLDARFAAVFKQ